jgi:hypothetical protein
VRWLALAILILAGCGGSAPVTEPTATVTATKLLLAYEAGNHLHHYGGRVFADGRYELHSTAGEAKPQWKTYEPFTPEQVATIEAAIDATTDLPAHIAGSDPPPPDASNATFTLKGRTIEVDEWPKAAPRLEQLLTTIAELRKKPPVPSTWRLWSDGKVVELEARCDIGEVAALRAISDALFMNNGTDEAPAADDPPDGTPLVSVKFGEERLEVFADGKRVDRAGGKETTQKLGADRVNTIRNALAATDWAKLPSRLC